MVAARWNYTALLGRILLGTIFLLSGFQKLTHWSQTAALMHSKGLPMVPVMLAITILIEIGAAILMIIGWHARWAALIMFLYMIPVTLVFHNFWASPPDQKMMQTMNFLKNLGIMGGLLQVYALGIGRATSEERLGPRVAA